MTASQPLEFTMLIIICLVDITVSFVLHTHCEEDDDYDDGPFLLCAAVRDRVLKIIKENYQLVIAYFS